MPVNDSVPRAYGYGLARLINIEDRAVNFLTICAQKTYYGQGKPDAFGYIEAPMSTAVVPETKIVTNVSVKVNTPSTFCSDLKSVLRAINERIYG